MQVLRPPIPAPGEALAGSFAPPDRARCGRSRLRAPDLGQWVDTLERRLEKSWARLTAKQVSVVEQLMVALGNPPAQSGGRRDSSGQGPPRH